ncbi:MAG: class I SAM-dependent methyltransferase [Bythopirellula sp.]
MLRFLRDQFVFLREFGSRFETTGSIVPSSRFLAQAITRYLAQRGEEPIRVLECGPGTGAFTDQIVRHLRPGDRFDLVELNEAFVDVLRQRFANEPHWQAVAEQAEIHQLPLQEFADSEPYSFIISGLPHVNFPAEVVETIFESYFRLLQPGGTLSYFEYMYIRPLRRTLTIGQARRKIVGVNRVVESYLQQHRLRRENTFINFPPAWVQHLRELSQPVD